MEASIIRMLSGVLMVYKYYALSCSSRPGMVALSAGVIAQEGTKTCIL